MSIAAAALLYLMANFLRSIRFWLLIKRANLSLTHTFALFQVTNVIGGLWSAPLAELCRIAGLIRLCGASALIAVLSVTVYCRLLDFVVASAPLLVSSMAVGAQRVDSNSILVFVLVGAGLGFVTCSRDAVSFVKRVLVARGHSAWHLQLIKILNEVETGFYRFLDHPGATLFFNLLLTLFIWTLDVLAFKQVSGWLGLAEATLWEHVTLWSQHAYGRFFGLMPVDTPGIQKYLMWPQAGFALVLVILCLPALVSIFTTRGSLWKSR